MAVDIFDPREMAEAFKQRRPAPSFLRDMFGGPSREYFTENVDIDIQIDGVEQAPFILPNAPATMVDLAGFRSHSYAPPHIRLKGRIGAEHLRSRLAGEDIYSGADPNSRKPIIIGELLGRLDNMIKREEEIMVAETLQTGSFVVKDQAGATLDTISFGDLMDGSTGWVTTHLVTPAVKWDDGTVADRRIRENLFTWSSIISTETGRNATDAVLGIDAYGALMADVEDAAGLLNGLLDNRRVQMGEINPRDKMGGAQYVGQLKVLAGLDLWVYSAQDKDGAEIMDPDKVIIGSRDARTEFRYGAVEKPTDDKSSIELTPGARVMWGSIVEDPPQELVFLASRPLYVPIELGAFVTADVMT